jgi:DNA-binding transcriptional regulator PaaX
MPRKPAFMQAYPLTARAVLHTPLVFRAGLESFGSLPWPSLEGLRDFARFAGIGDGALRTALSRARAEASLLVEEDASGIGRYALAPATFAMGTAQIHAEARPEGFLLAVFSFRQEENEERAALRALLKSFGFRKLAQNTYIHGRIGTEALKAAAGELGLADRLFLFTCPEIDDADLVKRILDLFDIEGRRRELREYLVRLKAFLPDGLPRDELARRLLYVGAVHYERVETSEPPFPAKYLPADYALREIQGFYGQRLEGGHDALLAYYLKANQQGGTREEIG